MTGEATVPLDLGLVDPEGSVVTLGEVLAASGSTTVVQLVRYFGCLPCQEWTIELDRSAAALRRLDSGAVAVGGSADYQARWLREEKGVSLPMLLDPEHRLRDHVGAARPLGVRMLDPRGASAYVGSLRRGLRPQSVTRDTVRSPGVVVLDSTGSVRWSHVGRRIGDYPAVAEVIDAVAGLG